MTFCQSAGQGGEKWADGCRSHDFRPRYGSDSSQPSDVPRHRKYRSSEAGTAIVQREALICILYREDIFLLHARSLLS